MGRTSTRCLGQTGSGRRWLVRMSGRVDSDTQSWSLDIILQCYSLPLLHVAGKTSVSLLRRGDVGGSAEVTLAACFGLRRWNTRWSMVCDRASHSQPHCCSEPFAFSHILSWYTNGRRHLLCPIWDLVYSAIFTRTGRVAAASINIQYLWERRVTTRHRTISRHSSRWVIKGTSYFWPESYYFWYPV